jgi:membrane-bound lytic murein transglycosylase D
MKYLTSFIFICFFGTMAISQSVDYNTDSIFNDNVYWKRLQKLNNTIKPYFDEQIQEEITALLKDPKTPIALGKYFAYQDTIKKLLAQFGLPEEMQLIAFSNTYMDEGYKSTTGETGCWPLPYYVGKKYELIINSYIDERRDIFASTYAAAKSLADLYHIYRDWYFTISVFKCGPIEMNKAIRMAGNSLDYFIVEPYIESKYRRSFTRFMASMYVVNYYQLHQIKPQPFKIHSLDTICTPRTFTFKEIADGSRIPYEELIGLNLKYKKQKVLHEPISHCFNVKKGGKAKFYSFIERLEYEEEQKRIKDSLLRVEKYIKKFQPDSTGYQIVVVDGMLTVLDSAGKKIDPEKPLITSESNAIGNRWVYYTVKKGDVLYLLTDVFDVSLKDVKRWNKLRSNTIVRGQRLRFLVPANKYSKYSSINRMSASQKQRLRRKD